MKILEIYFSGTGNTKWVASRLADKLIAAGHRVRAESIEDLSVDDISKLLVECQLLIVLHPAYGNDMPEILEDYLIELNDRVNFPEEIKGLSIVVPALYSADGARATEWFFDDAGIDFIGGYNVWIVNTLLYKFYSDILALYSFGVI